MNRFKFRLATLLKLREAARDGRRAALAEAYQAEAVLRQQTEKLGDRMAELRREYRHAAEPGALQVDRLVERQRYDLVLRAEQELSRQRMGQLEEEIERRREALVDSDRDVKVLEKLRERKQHLHEQEAHRQEVKQLDEVAARSRQEGPY